MKTKPEFISSELRPLIIKAIGYRDTHPSCKSCRHSREIDGQIDREWFTACTLVENIGLITVSTTGFCDKYEGRL